MNETYAVTMWSISTVVFIAIAVRWFLAEGSKNDYIEPKKQVFDDFYSLGRGVKK